jgi:hypothetical protein
MAPAQPAAAVLTAPPAASALAAPRAAIAASAAADGPRAIDALRANAPLADALPAVTNESSPEDTARAVEENFEAAASLGGGSGGGSVVPPASGRSSFGPNDPLLTRLLAQVRLDEGGTPERRAALTKAFAQMLETPTGRAYAERFIAERIPAVVRFDAVEGSRVFDVNGRKLFYAPRAFTEWKVDHVEVRVNLDYLGTDAEFQREDLPPTLAHELFGHGLWYARAARENALQAFHHHELNETNARLVGWMVDFERDARFEENGAWSYLQNPAAFLSYLKLRLPYYALTWSTQELSRPRETLEERLTAARSKRADLTVKLSNHNSWNGVIDHFVSHHGLDESKLRALRGYMTETAKGYEDEIRVVDSLIAEVDATVGRMNAEPDRSSEAYLKWAATHPMFSDLAAEVDRNTRQLIDRVSRTPARMGDVSPEAAAAQVDHWRGQITFDQLVAMYRQDRERNPGHWRQ